MACAFCSLAFSVFQISSRSEYSFSISEIFVSRSLNAVLILHQFLFLKSIYRYAADPYDFQVGVGCNLLYDSVTIFSKTLLYYSSGLFFMEKEFNKK
ncbi:MAG: hypothetical protein A2X78_02435 [Gammaproteobacteria bacterium GWE2_37_16]|nr:MAG: hypothetical protein A2X78_02435 [Gammaproteobacteria bacterium GWE2_37_16]